MKNLNLKKEILNHVFSRKVVGDLLKKGSNEIFDCAARQYVSDFENKTYGEIFSEIYVILGKERRNEYYYMNILFNYILEEIEGLACNREPERISMFSQKWIGRSVADFIVIKNDGNEDGEVFEIKSDLDNLSRLQGQLEDYHRAFDTVSVLSSEDECKKIEDVLAKFGEMGKATGIHVLSDNGSYFSVLHGREPYPFVKNLDHKCIFNLLRK
ncbi:hypothetical protein FACS1894187_22170 [Synergistales bacterium]|nr:hypothetical protein FACS1894187_22170 [Synergistales bacterium]